MHPAVLPPVFPPPFRAAPRPLPFTGLEAVPAQPQQGSPSMHLVALPFKQDHLAHLQLATRATMSLQMVLLLLTQPEQLRHRVLRLLQVPAQTMADAQLAVRWLATLAVNLTVLVTTPFKLVQARPTLTQQARVQPMLLQQTQIQAALPRLIKLEAATLHPAQTAVTLFALVGAEVRPLQPTRMLLGSLLIEKAMVLLLHLTGLANNLPHLLEATMAPLDLTRVATGLLHLAGAVGGLLHLVGVMAGPR